MAGNREFFNRRLHSLLGVIPVGVYLTVHLVVNHFATKGEEAYNSAVEFMGNLTISDIFGDFCYLFTDSISCNLWTVRCVYSEK